MWGMTRVRLGVRLKPRLLAVPVTRAGVACCPWYGAFDGACCLYRLLPHFHGHTRLQMPRFKSTPTDLI